MFISTCAWLKDNKWLELGKHHDGVYFMCLKKKNICDGVNIKGMWICTCHSSVLICYCNEVVVGIESVNKLRCI